MSWFYLSSGNEFGPFSKDELISKIENGEILYTDMIRGGSIKYWTEVSKVKEVLETKTNNVNNEAASVEWFYEKFGMRRGPIPTLRVNELIRSKAITENTQIWKKGCSNWMSLKDSEFRGEINGTESAPPPLPLEFINNFFVGLLAFAPAIGYLIEWILAFAVADYKGDAIINMMHAEYWYVTLVLNIGLAVIDDIALSNAGYETRGLVGWVWFVPLYLYRRAKATGQSASCFYIWMCSFLIVEMISVICNVAIRIQ